MATLLDLSPDTAHPVLSGAAEIEQALDRMLIGTSMPFGAGDCAGAVQALERIGRRVEAVKLKLLAAADKSGTAADAGFTGTDAWVARQTTTSRTKAAREVALATELDTGSHDATAAALDEGLVSPAHAAVIVNAGKQLPDTVSDQQRRVVEAALIEKAHRFDPDQLRRRSRRRSRGVTNEQEERSGGCSAWDASATPPTDRTRTDAGPTNDPAVGHGAIASWCARLRAGIVLHALFLEDATARRARYAHQECGSAARGYRPISRAPSSSHTCPSRPSCP